MPLSDFVVFSPEDSRVRNQSGPLVALETTVVTHGLPYPETIQFALDMESAVRHAGATPATIALMDGKIRVGLSEAELARLAGDEASMKVSHRDLATALIKRASGGTTVAATTFIANKVGIKVCATGGIGGVHKESPFDVSTDLHALADTGIVVVCAGAKAILDLPSTLEYLETMGVPVIGFKTDEFPAFYSRESGLKVSLRLDTPQAIAEFANTHISLGLRSAVVVANPIPETDAVPRAEIEPVIAKASKEALDKHIHGQALTPFLLERVSELTGHKSMRANLALLLNNARLAAQIASAMATHKNRREI